MILDLDTWIDTTKTVWRTFYLISLGGHRIVVSVISNSFGYTVITVIILIVMIVHNSKE